MADDFKVQSEPNGIFAIAAFVDTSAAPDEIKMVTDANPLPVDVSAGGGATEATLLAVESAVDGLEALLAPPSSIGNGATKTVTAAATPEQLTGSSTPCRAVYLRAPSSNTGVVGWGGSGIAGSGGNGPQLGPGDEVWIPIDNATKIYLSAAVNGEGVKWSYVA